MSQIQYRVIIIWYFCNIMAADCRFSLHSLIGSTSSLLHPVISWQTQAFSIHHYTLIQWQHCLQGTDGGLCWHSNAVSPKLHWTLIFWCRLWQHVCLPMYLPPSVLLGGVALYTLHCMVQGSVTWGTAFIRGPVCCIQYDKADSQAVLLKPDAMDYPWRGGGSNSFLRLWGTSEFITVYFVLGWSDCWVIKTTVGNNHCSS